MHKKYYTALSVLIVGIKKWYSPGLITIKIDLRLISMKIHKDKSIKLVDRLVNMKYGTCFARFNALAERKEDHCAILKYVLTNKQQQ